MIIGYIFTLAYMSLLLGLIISLFASRKMISKALARSVNRASIAAIMIIILFFIIFSVKFVNPTEQLYFDENIYQGIALNILHNGNALWCQYGTAYLNLPCQVNQIYHDPTEISFYLAMAFAIFGIGVPTAFGLELAVGAFSVFLVFLLSSLLFGKKAGIASAAVFALLPELFIWSRAEAVPNLIFMMFTILAFFAYVVYRKRKCSATLAFLLFALGIAVYTRIEAMLLIPLIILVSFADNLDLHHVIKGVMKMVDMNNKKNLVLISLFIILIIPQIYYVSYEAHRLDYGSGSVCGSNTTATFSMSNLKCNGVQNLKFFLGYYNSVSYYPAYFSPLTTAIAIIGFLLLVFYSGSKRGKYDAFMLGAWILIFHVFYDSFYAGSVTFGVDVRFMLIIYPAMAISAGFGIARISDILAKSRKKAISKPRAYAYWLVVASLIALFIIYPFVSALGTTTMPYSQMQQESAPLAAVNFIHANYRDVPANCLVFTFTPDIWYGLNRSASQVGYFNSQDSNFTKFESRFSCFVFDWGYWCNTQNFKNSTCQPDISQYNLTVIASENSIDGTLALYKLNNYKP
ncbi:glycosyltransferase family 39 protein [Candidatus Marsarchaeota archaeon]|nr:glycosyltransferase family 39 protein [Candidatus Marsarchaeota archaeon]